MYCNACDGKHGSGIDVQPRPEIMGNIGAIVLAMATSGANTIPLMTMVFTKYLRHIIVDMGCGERTSIASAGLWVCCFNKFEKREVAFFNWFYLTNFLIAQFFIEIMVSVVFMRGEKKPCCYHIIFIFN